jgi:hypothetical protein
MAYQCGIVLVSSTVKTGGNMRSPLRQRASVTEHPQPDFEMQPLLQYLDLLHMSLDQYEYLKKEGAPDIVLYMEKGLIDRQIQFLSKVCGELTK